MPKEKEIKENCPECQFENGKHSFECSHYKEPTPPQIKGREKEFRINFGSFECLWQKRKSRKGEWTLFNDIKSFICQILQQEKAKSYQEGIRDEVGRIEISGDNGEAIKKIRQEERIKLVEEIDKLIAEEMLIANKEGQPTSRLTSLMMRIKNLPKTKT